MINFTQSSRQKLGVSNRFIFQTGVGNDTHVFSLQFKFQIQNMNPLNYTKYIRLLSSVLHAFVPWFAFKLNAWEYINQEDKAPLRV